MSLHNRPCAFRRNTFIKNHVYPAGKVRMTRMNRPSGFIAGLAERAAASRQENQCGQWYGEFHVLQPFANHSFIFFNSKHERGLIQLSWELY